MQTTSVSTTDTIIRRGLRTFYILATAQTVSQIGSNMSFLAVGIYVYQKTGQATPLALLSLFLILPRIIAGGIAGILADRNDRRTLMVLGDMGAAVGSLALVISIASGNFQVWHVYAAALWQALFSTIQRPAFEASVSQLVPDSQRHRANAIIQMSGPAALLLSSALTGLLFVAVGVIGIFLIDLISFFVAVVTTLFLRIPVPSLTKGETQSDGSMLSEWRSGINFLWLRRPLLIMIAQVTLFGFFISSVFSLMTPYVLARTGNAPTLGILTSILSIGGVAGALLIGVWGGFKRRIDTIMIGMILVLVTTMWFGTKQSTIVMGATLFMAMMGVAGINTMSMTLLQSKVPGDMQGRIFAIFTQLSLILTPVGYLLIGPLADQLFTPLASSPAWKHSSLGTLFGVGTAGGMGALFTVCGGLALITTLVIYILPSVRHMETTLPTYRGGADVPPISYSHDEG